MTIEPRRPRILLKIKVNLIVYWGEYYALGIGDFAYENGKNDVTAAASDAS